MQLSHSFTAILVYPDGSVREHLIRQDEATGAYHPLPYVVRSANPTEVVLSHPDLHDDQFTASPCGQPEVEPLSI